MKRKSAFMEHKKAGSKKAKLKDIKHYSMVIQWDPRDDIYIVTVPELPGCRTHGKTYKKAVKQGQDAIESWIIAAVADNEAIPSARTLA